jgi:heme a synthase
VFDKYPLKAQIIIQYDGNRIRWRKFAGMTDNPLQRSSSRQVAVWLFIGVGMIAVQVLLGGITRLTESGLSITEWKPITGMLPPLNDGAWQAEFDKYKLTDQFKYVHSGFSLSDFKFIFFWEWFHRLWARLMGMVFLAGFIYFLVKRKFTREMVVPMVFLFLLGAMQGAIGWLMVKSGLVPEKYFVGHIELTTHLVAALGLLCYVLWFGLGLLVQPETIVVSTRLKNFLWLITGVFVLQLVYGGFMAGLKAAVSAPTWPDINGNLIPSSMNELSPFYRNLFWNPITIHFIHRGLAYLLFILILAWRLKATAILGNRLFNILSNSFLLVATIQVVLGVITILNATHPQRLVVMGVLHQFTAMVLLANLFSLLFVVRKKQLA